MSDCGFKFRSSFSLSSSPALHIGRSKPMNRQWSIFFFFSLLCSSQNQNTKKKKSLKFEPFGRVTNCFVGHMRTDAIRSLSISVEQDIKNLAVRTELGVRGDLVIACYRCVKFAGIGSNVLPRTPIALKSFAWQRCCNLLQADSGRQKTESKK